MFRQKFAVLIAVAAVTATPAFAQVGTLDKIKASGTITMGVRDGSIPLSYTIGAEKYVGFHVDICNRIIDAVRGKLDMPNLKVAYQVVTSQNRIPLVRNGTVDIECGSTTNNATRQKDVAFAVTTFIEEGRVAVRTDSGIKSIAGLKGKTIVATTGTTTLQHLRRYESSSEAEFKEVFGKDHQDSFLLLESGRADGFVNDGVMLASLIASSKNPKNFAVVGDAFYVEPIAIMLRKDDPAFKKLADDTIRSMAAGGALLDLWTKWYLRPIPPNGITIGLDVPAVIKAAWANPNDKPAEEYAKR